MLLFLYILRPFSHSPVDALQSLNVIKEYEYDFFKSYPTCQEAIQLANTEHRWFYSGAHLCLKLCMDGHLRSSTTCNLPLIFWNHPFIIFRDIKMGTWSWSANSIEHAWSDCTDVQAGMALYWRQRLITFGSCRIRVN